MRHAKPSTIYLKDYRVPDYLVDNTHLHFELKPKATLVKSRLKIRRNPAAGEGLPPLFLDGVDLILLSIAIDGALLSPEHYEKMPQRILVAVDKPEFFLDIQTCINPEDNTTLEGLYLSNGMYCTQCEAEGFRRITFYPDRPDIMSKFTTTIVAPKEYPVLLSNGNEISRGPCEGDHHYVTWEDPFAKPAYLFALVAGNLQHLEDCFITASGRKVKLQLFTEEKNINKGDHALRSLKNAMRWDEAVYGREYDLDIFMIVAVDHFNMGAMENKGLNIFNSACVLASPETATDATFQRIESIVGHEYFHNWSGNRVTCRDWFQLSLKEGFTVFRDAEFSADMNSRAVKRIEDVSLLRTNQFAEDAGPMAHPVRPDSYMEISNFYTLTVYEKGAEVVRMIHTLLGPRGFRKGSDLYFERHDGCAVTCEDFVRAMEDANQVDLVQFRRWYSQAGTPQLTVTDYFDETLGTYVLTVRQSCPPTPGQREKSPFHIPLKLGLLDKNGNELVLDGQGTTQCILEVTEAEQSFEFTELSEKPLPSLLRDFSAPVKIDYPYSIDQLLFLMSNDSDIFNRWDASQRLAFLALSDLQQAYRTGGVLQLQPELIAAYRSVLLNRDLEPALVAELLQLPSEQSIAEASVHIDAEAIVAAREFALQTLAEALFSEFRAQYTALKVRKSFSLSAKDIAERKLKNTCLLYLCATETADALALAQEQFDTANNMTDKAAALSVLINHAGDKQVNAAIEQFYQCWKEDAQVVELWFGQQSRSSRRGNLSAVEKLIQHPAFDLKNPNRVRAVIGGFAKGNFSQFHRSDGSGFEFLAEQVITLDKLNPQIAAQQVIPITRWKRYTGDLARKMKIALKKIMDSGDLSGDLYEVVSKSLN
ncbi:aminopeptidase N [Microbulbifer sp. 2205BS26-8]|uniref:aminopeptidase N n=1 Tax=Microbulbifer sp. 2205BS26-8 TaxID=3064386 RepID=UPI00273D9DBB|nr:aminopeptidase N [Microbulbifer sp. 2205BS26-8]MDP5209323.1 aminopeptidase N [Microbulbifer sp. 2205BS26-8]